jgi:hypothetical protein
MATGEIISSPLMERNCFSVAFPFSAENDGMYNTIKTENHKCRNDTVIPATRIYCGTSVDYYEQKSL